MANRRSDEEIAGEIEHDSTDRLEADVRELTHDLAALEANVRELTHDLTALAQLASAQFGEPFRSHAAEIVTKRQTGNGRNP